MFYPLDQVNEKFLLKLRNCVVDLDDKHVLKKWLKYTSQSNSQAERDEEITIIFRTKYNLITDIKQRSRLVEMLNEVKGESLAESLVRSFLYLLLGNVAESNNQLKSIYQNFPFKVYQHNLKPQSKIMSVALAEMPMIIKKLKDHPSDRTHYQLASAYLLSFLNDPEDLRLLKDFELPMKEDRLKSGYIQALAHDYILSTKKDKLNPSSYQVNFLFQWVLAFSENEIYSKAQLEKLIKYGLESNYLWLIYSLNSERLMDIAMKESSRLSINARRSFLMQQLSKNENLLMSVYKLIELGAIDAQLIELIIKSYEDV